MNQLEEFHKAKLLKDGWLVYHSGLPDFFCFRNDGDKTEVMFVEIKSSKDQISAIQSEVIAHLIDCGFPVKVMIDRHESPFISSSKQFHAKAIKGYYLRLLQDIGQVEETLTRLRGIANKLANLVEPRTPAESRMEEYWTTGPGLEVLHKLSEAKKEPPREQAPGVA